MVLIIVGGVDGSGGKQRVVLVRRGGKSVVVCVPEAATGVPQRLPGVLSHDRSADELVAG